MHFLKTVNTNIIVKIKFLSHFRIFGFSFIIHFFYFFISFVETYFEIELVKKLEITIEKQRNEIKKLDQSMIDYKAENEEVSHKFSLSGLF